YIAHGEFDKAVDLLDGAEVLPLENIAELIAEQTAIIDAARQKAAEAMAAAYAIESDKVWALFKQRKYAEADTLLAALADKKGGVAYQADLEASKCLGEFWGRVEKWVVARRGKFVSIAGAGGNVASVKDSVVTLERGAATFTRRIDQLAVTQALAYAGLKADERSNLLKGVFLLAEGVQLADAKAALAKAGDMQALAVYQGRLGALALDVQETAARPAGRKNDRTAQATWALDLAGPDSYVTVPHMPFDEWSAFTVEVWVKNWRGSILCQGQGGDPQNSLYVGLGAGDGNRSPQEACGWESGKGRNHQRNLGHGAAEAWNHVAMVYDGKQQHLFLNGERKHSQSAPRPGPLDRTHQLVLGRHDDRATRGDGGLLGSVRISKVARYSRAFTPEKRWQSDAATALLLHLNEGRGARARDTGRYGKHGAIHRGTWVKVEGGGGGEGATTAPKAGGWKSLFDGKTLTGWRKVSGTNFAKPGSVGVAKGCVVLERGEPATGIASTLNVPTDNYELTFEAMRLGGTGHLVSVLFPIGTSHCELCIAGFSEGADTKNGLKLVDGRSADNNVTTRRFSVQDKRWYEVRLQVTTSAVGLWVDDVKKFDVSREEHQFSMAKNLSHGLRPLGIFTWYTHTAIRNVALRRLPPEPRVEAPKAVGKWERLFDGRNPAECVRQKTLVPTGKMDVRAAGDYVRLHVQGKGDKTRLWTKAEFSPPFAIRVVAMTDSTNLRLYYAGCRLIFNWEGKRTELRFHGPEKDRKLPVPGQGAIPVNKFVEVLWVVEADRSTISVDGEERAVVERDFSRVRGKVGVGPAAGSTITLKELSVGRPKGGAL
ncbi:DUF1080 domain-containing protein, partial [bacterium]|nr:DUF1080 domain-containing protein [bacterium]